MEEMRMCEKCGEHEGMYNLHPHNDKRTQLVCDSCFANAYWAEYIGARMAGDVLEDGRVTVRCEGTHFVLGVDSAKTIMRGHGGSPFTFQFTDGPYKGQTITCGNVWCQGEIPDKFREYLPDNAVIVPQKHEPLFKSEVLSHE